MVIVVIIFGLFYFFTFQYIEFLNSIGFNLILEMARLPVLIRSNISEIIEVVSAKYEWLKKLVSIPVASIVSMPSIRTIPSLESPTLG